MAINFIRKRDLTMAIISFLFGLLGILSSFGGIICFFICHFGLYICFGIVLFENMIEILCGARKPDMKKIFIIAIAMIIGYYIIPAVRGVATPDTFMPFLALIWCIYDTCTFVGGLFLYASVGKTKK